MVPRFDVKLHDPVRTVVHTLPQLLTGLVGTAFWSEPVRAVSEVGLENWFKHRFRGRLDHAISDRRDA